MKKSHPTGPEYVPGEVLVRFKPGKQPKDPSSIDAGSMSASGIRGWTLVKLHKNESVDHAQVRFRADPRVEDATPNHIYHSLSVPNDSLFGWQWGLQNTGQPFPGDYPGGVATYPITGTPGADISATSAWDVTTGSSSVKVAIVDSGVATDHPDLAPNIDTADAACFDPPAGNPPICTQGVPWYDDFGHGTHVAGIAGASANDGFGVSGVAQHVSLMPIKVLDDTGSGYTTTIAQGFQWAASHGAKVVNASLGGGADPALLSAINGAPNTLFVVAAGNDGVNNDAQATYPCNYTAANLICVAASDQNDDLASFSNYGRSSVDLAAPGVNIWSTFPPSPAGLSSTHALEDSPSGGYPNTSDTWVATASAVDLTGKTGCNLKYAIRGFLADSNDVVTVQTSTDGGTTWNTLSGSSFSSPNSSTTWTSENPGLGADGQLVMIRFRLRSDGAGTDDGVYIDDVSVACTGPSTVFSDDFESGMSKWTVDSGSQWGIGSKFWEWAFDDGTSMATPFVTGTAALVWAHQPNATVAHVKNVILGSVDAKAAFSGKTVTGGRLNALRALLYSDDNTAPTGAAFTGTALTKPYQLGASMSLGWTAHDSGTGGATGVKDYDIRYERAPFNGGFGAWTTWKSETSATSATFSSAPGYSYCFEVRARDRALNVSGWSAPRCTSFPVNDTQMTASAGWTRAKSSTRYLGTDSYTKTKGATLTLAKVYFRRMDLVVTLCPGCGSIAVYFGSTYFGTYSLNATTTQTRHLTLVRSYSHVVGPATVLLRVTTSGKPIAIEGLGVFRY